jgi:branched-chain amino acid aminotransferase
VGDYINFNGSMIRSDEPVISAQSRAFRYGDGVFETMYVKKGVVQLSIYHFDRLFSGIHLLQFIEPSFFSREILTQQIKNLCEKNNHVSAARVRLAVFRGAGGLYDTENLAPNYIIESWPIEDEKLNMSTEGLHVDIFPDGRKSMDIFSNIKSNNYLLYAMAALYAKKNNLSDCFIINSNGRVCDSSIANVFCVKDQTIYTSPLSEACIAGVMRRHLMNNLPKSDLPVKELPMEIDWLQTADEIFLTNAISGVRWIKQWGHRSFKNEIASFIFEKHIKNTR